MALRTHGIRVRRGPLSLTHLHDSEDHTRLAFAIGRKVGPAVVRNRLRRRLRAIIADLDRQRSPLLPTGVLLVSAGPDAVDRSHDELSNDVTRLLDELRDRRAPR